MLFLGNVDKLIYFRFYHRVNLQEIITAQNEMPILIPSKSIPTIGCKRRKFPSKKERNRQLFPFKKEIFCSLFNSCGFSYLHKRREYLSGKANE